MYTLMMQAEAELSTKTDTFGHVLDRELAHMAGALFITTCFYFFYRFLQRILRNKAKAEFLPESAKPIMVLSALSTIIVSMLREPYDASVGWMPKSYIDIAVWAVFSVLSAYAIYRIKYKD